MGWTTRRAVCDSCVRAGKAGEAPGSSSALWLTGLIAGALLVIYLMAR